MLMPSVHYKNGSDPLRPLPFLFPGFHPEAIPRPSRRNGEGKAGEMERQNRCYRRSIISAPGHIRLLKRKVASLWFLAWKRESVMVVHRPPCRYCTLLGT